LQKYVVVHQTGDAMAFHDFERLVRLKETLPQELQKQYLPVKFINPGRVVYFLQQADLVIARSGINTVTELLYLGKPCLFIPIPHGQQNEQLTNARFVSELGLAEVANQNALTAESLYSLITSMINNLDDYKAHGRDARGLIDTSAADKIVEVITDAKKQKKKS
jgi:uncharacterized protein (TIGR00661 family)